MSTQTNAPTLAPSSTDRRSVSYGKTSVRVRIIVVAVVGVAILLALLYFICLKKKETSAASDDKIAEASVEGDDTKAPDLEGESKKVASA